MSSRPCSRRSPLGTSRGSKLLSLTRGTSRPIGPIWDCTGQLDPALLGTVDQLVEPGVVGQLLAQLPTGQPARRTEPGTSRHRIVIGHGHSVLPTEASPQTRTTSSYTDHLTGPPVYVYVDYFALYKPGLIDNLRAGVVFELDISPTLLTMMLASVAIPALMVMLSMTLPVRVNRVTNSSSTRTSRSALRQGAIPRPPVRAFVGRGAAHGAWSALVAIGSAQAARVIGVSAESTRARLCQRPGRIRLRG